MAGELILIIEDDDNSRKLLRDTLQYSGYRTIESSTGEHGLRLAAEHRPALILMDIQLPVMNGVQALRRLRANPVTRSVPVIAVTASLMNTQQNEFASAGFDALEPKPLSIVSLLHKMRLLLNRCASVPT